MRTALVAALLMLSLSCAHADNAAAARKAVQAAYDRMAAAAARRDVDGWLALKTPDFVSVSLDGKESTLDSRRASMKMVMTMMDQVRATTKILSFKLVNDHEALAHVQERTEMRFHRPDKTKSVMIIDTVADSTWIKTRDGWREKRSRSIKETGTLDGKPLPH